MSVISREVLYAVSALVSILCATTAITVWLIDLDTRMKEVETLRPQMEEMKKQLQTLLVKSTQDVNSLQEKCLDLAQRIELHVSWRENKDGQLEPYTPEYLEKEMKNLGCHLIHQRN